MTAALLSLSGCFTGTFLAGQPCADDLDCGPNLSCDEGRCAGATAGPATTSTSDPTTSTTAEPTTSSTTTTAESTSTTAEPTTSTTTAEPSTTDASTTDASTTDASTTGSTCGVGRCEMIDVLIVLDNSPSMSGKGNTLLSIIVAYAEILFPLLGEACSVHIGAITTNVFANNQPPCDQLGALNRGEDGEPCPFAEGKPYATTADLKDVPSFNCLLTVGAQGDPNERPIDTVYQSFGAALNNDCNGGFHREGALLLILLATDEDDGEKNDLQGHEGSDIILPNLWTSAISVAKGGNKNLYIAAVLGDADQEATACPWDPLAGPDGTGASPAPTLRAAIEKLPPQNRVIGSICDPEPDPKNYYPLFDEANQEIRALCDLP
ncbi:MAG: hypothetical protein IPK80_35385 [Nannocystis sp.]|nr:hypothetical protein [Nannocystis sp.]